MKRFWSEEAENERERKPNEMLLRVVDDTRARSLWCQSSVIGVTIARSGFKSADYRDSRTTKRMREKEGRRLIDRDTRSLRQDQRRRSAFRVSFRSS